MIHRIGFDAGNRGRIDHSYIRLPKLDLTTDEGRSFLEGVVVPLRSDYITRLPMRHFLALCWRVKTFRLSGSVHCAWHTSSLTGQNFTETFDFEVRMIRAARTPAEFAEFPGEFAETEAEILGRNVGTFLDPLPSDLASLPLMNYGFYGGFDGRPDSLNLFMASRGILLAPFPASLQSFPVEDNFLYYEDRETDENQVYAPLVLAGTMSSDATGPTMQASFGLCWPWPQNGGIPLPAETPFDPDPSTEYPPGTTDNPSNGNFALHAGSVTMKINGLADIALPLMRTAFIVFTGFGTLPAVRTLEVAGTLEAVEFWPYRNSEGLPVYKSDTGEQLRDPLS